MNTVSLVAVPKPNDGEFTFVEAAAGFAMELIVGSVNPAPAVLDFGGGSLRTKWQRRK